jgi:hypothetical protein
MLAIVYGAVYTIICQQWEMSMSYQIATSETGIFVVLTSGTKIVRIVRKCEDQADAALLLRDLAGWRF